MNLQDTIKRYQEHIDQGHLDPNMPAFLLIGCDEVAPKAVRSWADYAAEAGTPPARCQNAREIAQAMESWPNRRVPGTTATTTVLGTTTTVPGIIKG